MSGPTFRQLAVFVEAAETASFCAAARRFGISQVSVSGHISALETILGQTLFLRSRGHAAELTPAGRLAYRRCLSAMEELDSLYQELGKKNPTRGRRTLIVAASDYIAYRFAPVLSVFGQRHPEWQLEFETSSAISVQSLINSQKADLAITMTIEGEPADNSFLLWTEPLAFVVAPHHPLAGKPSIDASALRAFPFVYLPKNLPLRMTIDKVMAHIGISGMAPAIQTENAALAIEALQNGKAIACLFLNGLEPEIANDRLTVLQVSQPVPSIDVRLTSTSSPSAMRARATIESIVSEQGEIELNPPFPMARSKAVQSKN